MNYYTPSRFCNFSSVYLVAVRNIKTNSEKLMTIVAEDKWAALRKAQYELAKSDERFINITSVDKLYN